MPPALQTPPPADADPRLLEALVITTNTVKRHLKAIFEKLEIHTRTAAAAKGISAGLPAEWPETGATWSRP